MDLLVGKTKVPTFYLLSKILDKSSAINLELCIKLPVVIPKGPTNKSNIELVATFDVLGLSLEFIHIPVDIQELPLQELGLGARKPNMETRWEGSYD